MSLATAYAVKRSMRKSHVSGGKQSGRLPGSGNPHSKDKPRSEPENFNQMQKGHAKPWESKPDFPTKAKGVGNFNYPQGQTLAHGGRAGDGMRPPFPTSASPSQLPRHSVGNVGHNTGGNAARNMYATGGDVMDEDHMSHMKKGNYAHGGAAHAENHVAHLTEHGYCRGGEYCGGGQMYAKGGQTETSTTGNKTKTGGSNPGGASTGGAGTVTITTGKMPPKGINISDVGGRTQARNPGGMDPSDEDDEDTMMARGGEMYAQGGSVTRPAKTRIPHDDQARLHDPVLKRFNNPSSEDFHPTYEPEKGSERAMHKQHDFPFRKQNYEYPPPHYEQLGSVKVNPGNLAENMFARGGIAKAIYLKHAKSQAAGGEYGDSGIAGGDRFKTDRAHEESDHLYADGGPVNRTPFDPGGDEGGIYHGDNYIEDPEDEEESDAFAFGGGVSSGNRFRTDRGHEEEDHIFTKKYAGNYARGGRIGLNESIDNQYPALHPDNDFLSDEEQTPYFHYNADDAYKNNPKRKAFIAGSMRKAGGKKGVNTREIG